MSTQGSLDRGLVANRFSGVAAFRAPLAASTARFPQRGLELLTKTHAFFALAATGFLVLSLHCFTG